MKNRSIYTLAMLAAAPLSAMAEEQPNIIFLMTDDQAFNSIASLGEDHLKTPNLDRMVERGVSFTHHYATTSISMASRAIVMTGMYEYKTGCNFQHGPLAPEKFTKSYPVLLREAGYFTGFAGKFGFAVSEEQGTSKYESYDIMPIDDFDRWGGATGQSSYVTKKNEYMVDYADKYPHSTLSYGAFGCDFIDAAKESGKPFCLSISFKAPHMPLTPDPRFDHIYANTYFELPESAAIGEELLPMQAKLGRQFLSYYEGTDDDYYQMRMRTYHQLIYGVDAAVGMILDKLKMEGLDDNTIVIFTADNGRSLGARRLGGKVLAYETSSRIPLIIVDPRQEKSQDCRVDLLSGSIDIAPTLLDYAGVEIPTNVDGVSLRGVVENPKKVRKIHDDMMLINAWGTPGCLTLSVVEDNMKYIYWGFADGMDPVEELFDVGADPDELHNLVSDKRYAKKLDHMRELYDEKIEIWKAEATDRNNYKVFATIYDRHISWEERKALIPEITWQDYEKIVKEQMKVFSDPYDYETIVKKRL